MPNLVAHGQMYVLNLGALSSFEIPSCFPSPEEQVIFKASKKTVLTFFFEELPAVVFFFD